MSQLQGFRLYFIPIPTKPDDSTDTVAGSATLNDSDKELNQVLRAAVATASSADAVMAQKGYVRIPVSIAHNASIFWTWTPMAVSSQSFQSLLPADFTTAATDSTDTAMSAGTMWSSFW